MGTATAEGTQPTPTPATGEGKEAPTPPTGQQPTKTEDGNGAGSQTAVLADLAKERDKRQKLEEEITELKKKQMTEAEKAVADAKEEGKKEATLEANRRIVKSEIKAAAGGKLSNPEDAAALIGDLDRFITAKGEVDDKAIAAAIDDLVKSKPYLAANGSKAKALPGGGKEHTTGSSFNDTLRRQIRGG